MNVKQYGINDLDIEFAQMKLDKQKDYLSSNSILTSSGQVKTFLDMSMSANMSKRYYAEVTNRQNTNHSLALDNDLKATFLTVTLNGCWRDALRGDYSRFTPNDKRCLPSIVKMKIEREVSLNINDLIAVLNYQWDSFSSRAIFRGMQKIYTRVFEPHKKDGVPHIHVLLYIPLVTIPKALEKFKEIFNAPQNLKNNQLTYDQQQNGEINGFQWTLNNPTGYVMKYIQKTFMDMNNEEKLSHLSAWYVKHRVRRFLTSRSTIPLWVYRKIFFMDKDLYNLSSMVKDPDCVVEWNFENKYIRVSDPRREKEVIYNNGDYCYTLAGRELIKKDKVKKYQSQLKPISKTLERNKQEKPTIIKKGFETYHHYEFDNELVHIPIVPSKMSDYELYNYYYSLNIEEVKSLIHFGITQNEMIKRGLIDDIQIQSLNDFNTDMEIDMKTYNEVGIKDTKTQTLPNIDKKYFGLPKSDIVLPKDFDYSYSKDNKEVEKFSQGLFDFDTKIGA